MTISVEMSSSSSPSSTMIVVDNNGNDEVKGELKSSIEAGDRCCEEYVSQEETYVTPCPHNCHHYTPNHHHNHHRPLLHLVTVEGKDGRVTNSIGHQSHSSPGSSSKPQRRGGGHSHRRIVVEHLEHLGKGSTWIALLLGQLLSALLCISSITTVYLVDFYNIHVPNAQNLGFYLILAVLFTTTLWLRPSDRNLVSILRTRGFNYAIVALLDTEANFFLGKSLQFTSLTSRQLLDCFTIPTVLSFSWLLLRIRFKVPHILGVSICLLGISCLVWGDADEGRRMLAPGKNRFFGDMLCLTGAFLLGISSVAQEFVVKTFDLVEFLGMVGLFGSLFSGIQTWLLEYDAVTSADWTGHGHGALALLIVHVFAQVAFYALSGVTMKLSSATTVSLGLLTADFYSLVVGVYLFQCKFHVLYFVSFGLVIGGLIVFTIKPTVISSNVLKSLTREHTTTLDLELMASTPTSIGPTAPATFTSSVSKPTYLYQVESEKDDTTTSSSANV